MNDCKIFLAILVNAERGEFVIAFERPIEDGVDNRFGTAIYRSGAGYWVQGHYDLETDIDAHCDAKDRVRKETGAKS